MNLKLLSLLSLGLLFKTIQTAQPPMLPEAQAARAATPTMSHGDHIKQKTLTIGGILGKLDCDEFGDCTFKPISTGVNDTQATSARQDNSSQGSKINNLGKIVFGTCAFATLAAYVYKARQGSVNPNTEIFSKLNPDEQIRGMAARQTRFIPLASLGAGAISATSSSIISSLTNAAPWFLGYIGINRLIKWVHSGCENEKNELSLKYLELLNKALDEINRRNAIMGKGIATLATTVKNHHEALKAMTGVLDATGDGLNAQSAKHQETTVLLSAIKEMLSKDPENLKKFEEIEFVPVVNPRKGCC